jgi:predicted GNAT family acetyltransferase
MNATHANLEFRPLTKDTWDDFEEFFSGHHDFKGCWCMYWRRKRKEFDREYGEGNKQALKELVDSGETPGILAYFKGEAMGWCSVGPRDGFSVLDRSPTLKRVDNLPVWSIVCFLIARSHRGKGMMEALTYAAIDYARRQGAKIVEAYPLIPEKSKNPKYSVYMGIYSTFEKMGFKEVARRSDMRPVMRLIL